MQTKETIQFDLPTDMRTKLRPKLFREVVSNERCDVDAT